MDPTAIVTASAGLVRLCLTISGYIYTFVNNTKNVDTTIRVLGAEVVALSQILNSINESFSDRTLAGAALGSQTGHEGQHWRHVYQSMEDCKNTLRTLEQVMQKVKKGKGGVFGRAIKLELSVSEIALLKQQIAAYRQTMGLSLHLITVYVSWE